MTKPQQQARLEEYVDKETLNRLKRVMEAFDVSATEAIRRTVGVAWHTLEFEEQFGQPFIRTAAKMEPVPISFGAIKLSDQPRTKLLSVFINSHSEMALGKLLQRFEGNYSLSDIVIWLVDIGSTVLLAEHAGSYLCLWNQAEQRRERIRFNFSA